MAVASDASAQSMGTPLSDADIAAFSNGTARHMPDARIPSTATSPGFKARMRRALKPGAPAGSNGNIEVTFTGQVYVPPFSFQTYEGPPNGKKVVTKQYPGGFITVGGMERMDKQASSLVFPEGGGISMPVDGNPSVKLHVFFNRVSSPKTILVSVTQRQPLFHPTMPSSGQVVGYQDKPLGAAFIYRVNPDGGGA
ncbi:MAG: hypothetical protein KIT84_14615 [Labilithrix sp.]|nr:hypothetical protein [Labilithrix sp.]MCW5812255.1 hypothetical protein [Labilithrix sp.]